MRCGLLGERLGHSFSPQIHGELGDYSYTLFEKSPQELENFLKTGDFTGLNVTIPYKKAVIPYCARLSETAARLGSVNTLLRLPDGSLEGHNTDYAGFLAMVRASGVDPRGKKALVLGSGGASNTVVAALRDLGARPVVISRSGPDNYGNLDRHRDAALLVNATPVGMYPNVGTMAADPADFPRLEGVLDLIYNPARTALLLRAEALGLRTRNGLGMLVAQARESAAIWTGKAFPEDTDRRVEALLRSRTENLILIGMPGCGKSTLGRELAKRTGLRFVDADRVLEERAGRSIPEIFADQGEPGFRALETRVLEELGKGSGQVIATGGGCVTRGENYPLLHQNGQIFWIQRELSKLPKMGRPLSQTVPLEEMYRRRAEQYRTFADAVVDNNGPLSAAVEAILEKRRERT